MPYSETLAQRIRTVLADQPGRWERKMFGGVAFMLNGNMCCGVIKDDLMVRVGPGRHEEALALPHARPMDFTHRPMKGMVYVDPVGVVADAALAEWVQRGLEFALSLPPK
jgi:TfoX/Sxy family transcriptional regulator of competence genes